MTDHRESDRKMFAAFALQGMTSCISAFCETPEDMTPWLDAIPRQAVALADALIAELAKPPAPAKPKEGK